MNDYVLGAGVAFVLFGMGLTALLLGGINFFENKKSKSGLLMFLICACVFVWDLGYAWMSMSFSSAAYIFRAMALLAITFYMFYILRYVAYLAEYKKKRMTVFLILFMIVSLSAWLGIIDKDSVSFFKTP